MFAPIGSVIYGSYLNIPPIAVMSSVVSWQAVPTASGSLVSTTTFTTESPFSFTEYAVSARVQVGGSEKMEQTAHSPM